MFHALRGNQYSATCSNHLRQLGGVFTSETMDHNAYPESGGVPLLIAYRRRLFIQHGREETLTCPGDPNVNVPESASDSAAYDTVDVNDTAALGRMFSYAVRDFARFPLDPEATRAEWIMCDRQGLDGRTPHHRDGINVLFADGAVQFRDREALGLAPDEPIIVGPDSPHPELRKMLFLRSE